MSRADADSDDLRAFAKELKRFESRISTESRQLKSRFGGVHWRDSERSKFESELDAMLKSVNKSVSSIQDLAKYLDKKASELDRYLGR